MGLIQSVRRLCSRSDRSADRANVYKTTEEGGPVYSWDTDANRPDPKNFMFDGLEDSTIGKLPGEINGQQFVIQNCKRCRIFLFDHSAAVNVDDCNDCQIFIAPCKGSLFVRDSKDCQIAVACQQFRARDCQNIDIFLCCTTQPIIEASKHIRFACLQLYYEKLQDHLLAANLCVFNNSWSKVHDYTPTEGNCSMMDEVCTKRVNMPILQRFSDADAGKILQIDSDDGFSLSAVDFSPDNSLIPLTIGARTPPSKQVCFVICFSITTEIQELRDFSLNLIRAAQDLPKTNRLVQCKEIRLHSADLERILGTNAFRDTVEKGPIIGMEWSGMEVYDWMNGKLDEFSDRLYVCNQETVKKSLFSFYNFADMSLGV